MATLKWFFIAMLKHPEVQQKAQEEIDRVVGTDRVPDFEDRDHLPYIDAIWLEVMRWKSIFPISAGHAAREDGEYNGYLIPKGAMILPLTG
jgi:fumagillin biosynthesis cytochrome P450 monooxygenase